MQYDKVDPEQVIEELKRLIERLKNEKKMLENNNEKNLSAAS